ncbi:MAG: hypothetical protein M3Z05_23065 [Gemmatimonadota bacterium]|nr:hypothetical protein [Gemmatimonadota bacterium]
MAGWLHIGALLAVTGVLACSGSSVASPSEPLTPTSGAAPAPPRPGSRPPPTPVPLTEASVDDFIAFVMVSTDAQTGYIREQLAAARDSAAILDAFLSRIERNWRLEDGRNVATDASVLPIMFELVTPFRAPAAAERLSALTWRPLPASAAAPDGYMNEREHVEMLEAAAAEAFACIPGQDGELDRVITSHPSSFVRDSAADQRKHQWCEFMETGTRP